MRSSFASFLLTQKKRRPPAGPAAGGGQWRCWREKAFPREKPPPAPSRKAHMGKDFLFKKGLPACGSPFCDMVCVICGLLLLLFFCLRRKEGPRQGLLRGRAVAVLAGEGFSPGKAPSRTLPKSVYGKGYFVLRRDCRYAVVLFCDMVCVICGLLLLLFFCLRRKEGPRQGLLRRRGVAMQAGEGFSPGKAPSRTLPKSVYGKGYFVLRRDCRYTVVLFYDMVCVICGLLLLLFFCLRRKEGPRQGLLQGAISNDITFR